MESNKIKFLKKFNNLFISIKMTIFKKSLFFLFMALSLCLGTFFWTIINLPFLNSDIIGYYSINKISSLNDVLGYLVFITIPILFYFIWQLIFEKRDLVIFFQTLNLRMKILVLIKKIIFYFYFLSFLLF